MANRQSLVLLGCVLAALPLAGCHALPGTAEGDPAGRLPNITYEEPVAWYHDLMPWAKPLPRAVPVRWISGQRLATGSLQIVVEMRNNTAQQLRIEYRPRFLDPHGIQLEEGPWTLRILAPRVEEQVMFNSVSTAATDWRLHIRWAK